MKFYYRNDWTVILKPMKGRGIGELKNRWGIKYYPNKKEIKKINFIDKLYKKYLDIKSKGNGARVLFVSVSMNLCILLKFKHYYF